MRVYVRSLLSFVWVKYNIFPYGRYGTLNSWKVYPPFIYSQAQLCYGMGSFQRKYLSRKKYLRLGTTNSRSLSFSLSSWLSQSVLIHHVGLSLNGTCLWLGWILTVDWDSCRIGWVGTTCPEGTPCCYYYYHQEHLTWNEEEGPFEVGPWNSGVQIPSPAVHSDSGEGHLETMKDG